VSLSLHVQLGGGLAGVATLTNGGGEPTRVWRPGSELGDRPWRFELSNGARFLSDDVYTRNAPAAAELAPGEALRREFDLRDGTWRAEGDPGGATQLTAVYDVPMTPEAAEHGVWVGALRSEPVDIASGDDPP
jgi:hypothetical protein